uniref:Uncharacterized protein n=1 Tax=Anopheles atroparvus TaxID=41427 RepID=A0AAG5D8A9_ANOAO
MRRSRILPLRTLRMDVVLSCERLPISAAISSSKDSVCSGRLATDPLKLSTPPLAKHCRSRSLFSRSNVIASMAVGLSKSSSFSTILYSVSISSRTWRVFRWLTVCSKLMPLPFTSRSSPPITSMSMIFRGAVTLPHCNFPREFSNCSGA